MMKNILSTIFIIALLPYSSFTQEYSYTHYDITEGLAGSTAYCITQDKDGFIWIGTETGLSRFDGTHFKNFTMQDGLPDIEILEIFGDSKGRVWMAPFCKSVCYYYHNKIYNQNNDTCLKKIKLKGNVSKFAEDRDGNILIEEKNVLHLLGTDGSVRDFDSVAGKAMRLCTGIAAAPSGHFFAMEGKTLCELSKDTIIPRLTLTGVAAHFPSMYQAINADWIMWRNSYSTIKIRSISTGEELNDTFPIDIVNICFVDDSLLFIGETDGSLEYNLRSGGKRRLLPGLEVSRAFRDGEGSLWFTTIGHGVYRLNSEEIRNLELNVGGWEKCPVFSILKSGNKVYLGSSHQLLFACQLPALRYKSYKGFMGKVKNRIMFLENDGNKGLILGTDQYIFRATLQPGSRWYTYARGTAASVKHAFAKNARELLIAGGEGCSILDLQTYRYIDTLFHGRTTSVYYRQDTTYVGTLNGLYLVMKDKSIQFLGDKVPFFKGRIAAITGSDDGVLWVASYGAGIVGCKNGQIQTIIDYAHGLTSDICRTLLIQNNFLWVGTDKGLNRIDMGKPGYPVTRYTSKDGLASDIINTICADSAMMYVGTPAGLSYFDKTRTDATSGCRLLWLGLINSGHDRIADTSSLRLSYRDNNMRFEYVGISYKSIGNIQYRYRLLGLDSSWKETKETYLEYPSLPSGNYELQIEATNKFDMRSNPLHLRFVVTTPFWRTAWFYGMIILGFLSLTWLFVNVRIKKIRERQEESSRVSKKMMEMEQMALRAQMNPHFIFNCMTSIQQYIFDKDIFLANKYITGFARLIRATLQNSTQAYISLEEELDFLTEYLSLEQMRFKAKMDFSIEVDPMLSLKEVLIPPMLIQPFVENGMRHGLRHKKNAQGHIYIKVEYRGEKLQITIEDNGIGRVMAAKFKTKEHIEYQSKGMSLTADRIRLINSLNKENIRLEVIDLVDERGEAIGTQVKLHIPQFDHADHQYPNGQNNSGYKNDDKGAHEDTAIKDDSTHNENSFQI